jgi:hypothetical protein
MLQSMRRQSVAAICAVLLLVQAFAPVLHELEEAAEAPRHVGASPSRAFADRQGSVEASAHTHVHDPDTCGICQAFAQGRGGYVSLPVVSLAFAGLCLIVPRAPSARLHAVDRLTSVSPRAPPFVV